MVPNLQQLQALTTDDLTALKVEITDAMSEIDIQINDYSSRLKAGDTFPDPDWERAARHALGRHRQGLASIKGLLTVRHREAALTAAAEQEARRTLHMEGRSGSPANTLRRQLNQELFEACARLIDVDCSGDGDGTPDGFDEAFEQMATAWRAVRDHRAETP